MLIKKASHIKSSEITTEGDYLNRRRFIKYSLAAAGTIALNNMPLLANSDQSDYASLANIKSGMYSTDEKQNSWEDITTYNNFYEFGTAKDDPAENAHTLKPRPWKITIGGHCKKPGEYDVDDLIKSSQLEERI